MEDHKHLYNRFLDRQCTEEEAEQLLEYFRTKEGDKELVRLIGTRLNEEADISRLTLDDYAVISAVGKRIASTTNKRSYTLRKWLPYAAAVFLVVGTLSWLLVDKYIPLSFGGERQIDLASEDIYRGDNRATLRLGNGEIIVLDKHQQNIIVGTDQITYADGHTSVVSDDAWHRASLTDTLVLTTPNGSTYQVTLPDGSHIWLNAGTTLKYPKKFRADERVVYLEGEAFFDITKKVVIHSDDKNTRGNRSTVSRVPFKVVSNGQKVEVLGTKFNVSAYGENKQAYVTLTEGKVRVSLSSSVHSSNMEMKYAMLSPGQQAITSDQSINVKDVDTEPYTAWKNGVFHFDNTPAEIAVAELARWYDLEIAYQGEVPQVRLFAVIDRSKPLGAVLKSLEKSGLSFKVIRSKDRNKLVILGEDK